MNTTSSDTLLSLPTAAKQLDISVRSLYRLIARGELATPVKIGASSKLFTSDLEHYKAQLKSQRTI